MAAATQDVRGAVRVIAHYAAHELTPAAVKALGMLADAGIPMGCQTVLLAGVNDLDQSDFI